MIVDVHCHNFAYAGKYGGYVNKKFANSLRVRWYLHSIGIIDRATALSRKPLEPAKLDAAFRKMLVTSIDESKLTHAVLLAFDGVYDGNGNFDFIRTPKAVTNEATAELCKLSPKLLLGASVNPYRRDALDELARALELQAVLIKWLPSVMGFDPADPRIRAFYRKMFDAKIPLLVHIGFEYAVPNIDLSFNGLDRLEAALRTGVTVIAAHCCGGRPLIDSKKSFATMRRLVREYPNLYLDVSGMASIHRRHRLLNSIKDEEVSERLVFGTDFPIPLHHWAFTKELKKSGVLHQQLPENYFDQDIHLKRACGVDAKIMKRGYEPLRKVGALVA